MSKSDFRKLSPRADAYKQAVLEGKTKEEAKRIAGYSPKSSTSHIESPSLRAAITKHRQKQLRLADITTEKIVLQLGRTALWDPRRMFDENDQMRPVKEWDDDTAAGIAGFDIERRTERHGEETEVYYVLKPRSRDSVRAGEILLKYLTTGLGDSKRKDRLNELEDVFRQGPIKKPE